MPFGRRLVGILFAACLSAAVWSSPAVFAAEEDYAAVAYTLPNFQGIPWKIAKPGRYDLPWKIDAAGCGDIPMPFDLPNDSVCSIRVRPGYRVTIFEHATFGGDSKIIESDVADLGLWKRHVSSLVLGRSDEESAREWRRKVDGEKHGFVEPGEKLDREEIAALLDGYEDEFTVLRDNGESKWYGETTDEMRIDAGDFLLTLFGELGYDVLAWTPNSFAQQVNDFYDWRKDLSIWRTACLVLDIDAEMYEKIFEERRK